MHQTAWTNGWKCEEIRKINQMTGWPWRTLSSSFEYQIDGFRFSCTNCDFSFAHEACQNHYSTQTPSAFKSEWLRIIVKMLNRSQKSRHDLYFREIDYEYMFKQWHNIKNKMQFSWEICPLFHEFLHICPHLSRVTQKRIIFQRKCKQVNKAKSGWKYREPKKYGSQVRTYNVSWLHVVCPFMGILVLVLWYGLNGAGLIESSFNIVDRCLWLTAPKNTTA